MRSEAEISRDMAGKTKCCKYRITDASYSGSCEHPSCGCNANTVPMHKREQWCEHCRGTGRVTAGEQAPGLTERQRVAIQFYTDNPSAAEFDFGRRFDAHGVTAFQPLAPAHVADPRGPEFTRINQHDATVHPAGVMEPPEPARWVAPPEGLTFKINKIELPPGYMIDGDAMARGLLRFIDAQIAHGVTVRPTLESMAREAALEKDPELRDGG